MLKEGERKETPKLSECSHLRLQGRITQDIEKLSNQ